MSTKLRKEMKNKEWFDRLFEFKSPDEKLEHETYMLSFKFMHEVEEAMERQGLSKKQLAERIGTSASYITQLFRGNRLLNLKTLARLQEALNIRFYISEESKEEKKSFAPKADRQGTWVYHNFSNSTYKDTPQATGMINECSEYFAA